MAPNRRHSPSGAILRIVLLYALVAVVFCGPLWSPGFPDSHERLHHLVRVAELHDCLASGALYARWCPNLMGGYGLPLFNYYAPLAFYGAEALHAAGLPIQWAVKIWYCLMTMGAGLAFYAFARRFFRPGPAHVATMAYLFAPYHIGNLYVRGNIGEYTAMALLPGALAMLARLRSRPGPAPAALAAAAMALLILAHNITAMTGCALAAAWALALTLLSGPHRRAAALAWSAAAGTLALAASAFFWLPALAETRFINTAELTTGGNAIFRHFVYPWQLFDPRWGFGVSVEGPGDTMSFQVGLALWAFVFVAVVRTARTWSRPLRSGRAMPALFFLTVFAAAIALMLPITAPLYRLVSIAQYIQFPWRLLAISTVAGAWLAGYAVARAGRLGRWTVAAGILIALAAGAPFLRAPGYLPILHEYAGYNTRHFFIDTVRGEYTPPTVKRMPAEPSRWRLLLEESLRPLPAERIASRPTRHIFEVRRLPRPAPVLFEVFDFPGWRVYWNGEPLATHPSTPHGLVAFTLPGPGRVEIAFQDTPVRAWGELVSQIAWALIAAFILIPAARRLTNRTLQSPRG